MSSTYSIIRGSKVEFGSSNPKIPQTYGVVLNASCDTQAQTAPVQNSDGATVDIVVYDKTTTISLTVLTQTDATLPQIGDKITVNDIDGIITALTHNWTNAALRQLTITAISHANLIPATT